jgi:urea transport system substrate-binding protein
MGVVLQAHDPLIARDVAIKMLPDHLADDPIALGRFLAEARSAGKLNHPNVVAIYEICTEGPPPYLALEYVPGGSLDDRLLRRRTLSVQEATQAMIDACKGVGAAHAVGLIHRDIKPANFMRAADGSIKVADFGLAKGAADPTHLFTQVGMVVGTPSYMSPEQCENKTLDQRSDVYALGATYFTLLTGEAPYEDSPSVPQLMYAHCHGPIPDPRAVNPAIPEGCARIVARAMAKVPAERYQSAGEMLTDLEAFASTLAGGRRMAQPPCAPPPSRWGVPLVATLLGLVLIALSAVLWQSWRKSADGAAAATGVVPESGDPIKVGALHSLRGTMAASEAPVVDALLFAIDEVNQAGGVLGRRIELVVADGRSDEAVFATEAERLITKEKVCTVFGCWTSAARKTVEPIFEEHDHLLVYPVQYEGLETSPCIIYLGAAPNQQILPAVDWAMKTLHKKRFFLVGSDYVFPHAAHEIIKDHLRGKGAQVVGEKYLLLGSEQLEPIIDAIDRAKPDMILNTINGSSNLAFFKALRGTGITPSKIPTLSFSVSEQDLRNLNPAAVEGDYAAWTWFQSLPTPENQRFVQRFLKKYPTLSITDPMETAYIGVKLWAQAVNEAKSIEPKKIRRAMLNQQFDGPGGKVRIDPETQHCFRTPRIGQIQADGQIKVAWTAEEPVRPQPYPGSRSPAQWRSFLQELYTGWGNHWAAPRKPDEE